MIRINEELKGIIPPLTEDEFRQLEENILNEGIRDSICVWNGWIVDGHNRYEIAQRHGLEYITKSLEFDDIDGAKLWMIDNQKGRRNLADFVKYELEKVKKELLVKIGERISKEKAVFKGNQYTAPLSIVDNEPKHNTQKEIAKNLGWSTGKVAMADIVDAKADESTKDKLRRDEVTINKVYNDIKKQEKQERFIKKKQDFELNFVNTKTVSKCHNISCIDFLSNDQINDIDLVLSDPPYAIDYKSGWNDWSKIDGDKQHDTIELIDNCFNLLKYRLKDDAHIYIFGSINSIDYIKPLFCKYFKLKNILIWDRKVIGMGDLKTYGRSYDIVYFGYNETWKELNGTRDRDVLLFDRVSPGSLVHPTEKPAEILEYIIKKSTKQNDLVFDPFAGSCSAIKAAATLGRNCIGCELHDKYIPKEYLTAC